MYQDDQPYVIIKNVYNLDAHLKIHVVSDLLLLSQTIVVVSAFHDEHQKRASLEA